MPAPPRPPAAVAEVAASTHVADPLEMPLPDDAEDTAVRGAPVVTAPREMGTRLGRYLLIAELGRGGVGVVYRAYDPKLQREVAIKCVRPDAIHAGRQDRLVLEAQAMAKLNCANVVSVYDVEQDGDTVIIAMEHVDGTSLGRWLATGPHPWRDVVAKFVAAGRGLEAAHEAGMLHRDFKPGNVLLGADGRARVADFGLARFHDSAAARSSGDHDAADADVEIALDTPQTVRTAGGRERSRVLGTLPYMAPEQHADAMLTPAVDQYAFCVSVWQALVGELPFGRLRGQSTAELVARKLAGPPPWPKHVAVPRRLVDALRRGLAPAPGDRWPSMQALLSALTFEPGRNRRRVIATVGVIGVAWTTAVALVSRDDSAMTCAGAMAHLEGVWDANRRVQVERAMLGTEVSYAAAVWDRTAPVLDDYAARWAQSHTETCAATALRKEQSTEVMDLRMACLQAAEVELAAATTALLGADAQTMENAHALVAGLPALGRCDDVEALRAEIPPPASPDAAARVLELEALLADTRTRLALGEHHAALTILRDVADDVDAVGYTPLHTEWSLLEGDALRLDGAFVRAEGALRSALHSSLATRQWDGALRAAQLLTHIIGGKLKRHDEAMAFGQIALGLSAGLGDGREAATHDAIGTVRESEGNFALAETEYRRAMALWQVVPHRDPLAVARARGNIGSALGGQGRYDEAEAEQRTALVLRIAALGPEHPEVARGHNNLGNALYGRGHYAEAEAEYRMALALGTRALGPEHPDVASSHNNLGNALTITGEFAGGAAEQRTAIAIRERVLGPEHPEVAKSHNNLGNALLLAGDIEGAEQEYRTSLALRIATLGEDHPDVGASRHSIGNALSTLGEHDAANEQFELAIAIRERSLGPEHPDVAASRLGLGNSLYFRQAFAEAEQEYARVLEAWQRTLGPDHPDVGSARHSLGNVIFHQGRLAEAEAEYREALRIRETALGVDHPAIAQVAFGLGNTLEALGRITEAEVQFARALEIHTAAGAGADLRAEAKFALARTLWARPSERARARALAKAAREELVALGESELLTACTKWLALHRAR